MDTDQLLAAYDEQLRGFNEVSDMDRVTQAGPTYRAVAPWGGFVSYCDLGGLDGQPLDDLIADTVRWFRDETDVARAEWKTRGHDQPADLGARLEAHGFSPEEVETVMIGEMEHLTAPVELPPGVEIHEIGADDPRAEELLTGLFRMQEEVFGNDHTPDVARSLAGIGLGKVVYVVAVEDGVVISGGKIEPVAGTSFAGVWGGATRPEWRGKGVYRAVTSARARAMADRGVAYVYSDCTDMSRPILERAGLVKVTTTTPYVWERPAT